MVSEKHQNLISVYKIISNSEKIPFFIECKEETPLKDSFQDWAKSVLDVALPGELSEQQYSILKLISDQPYKGIEKILDNKNNVIVLHGVQKKSIKDPIWKVIVSNAKGDLIVFSKDAEHIEQEQWNIESMKALINDEGISPTNHQNIRLLRALSVLNRPIRLKLNDYDFTANEKDQSTFNKDKDKLGFNSSLGYMLYSSVQEKVIVSMKEDEKIEAHNDTLHILKKSTYFEGDVDFEEELLSHYMGAEHFENALACATGLIEYYRNQDRSTKIIETFNMLKGHRMRLPSHIMLIIAWSFMIKGRIKESELLLGLTQAQNVLDEAWKYGIKTEIIKSKAEMDVAEKALNEVNLAISTLEIGIKTNTVDVNVAKTRLLIFKHDKARILQFLFYETDLAIQMYREVISELGHQQHIRIDLAAAKKNLAHSLNRQLKEDFTGSSDKHLKEINILLQEALDLSKDFSVQVQAETLYEFSKFYEYSNEPVKAKEKLEECLDLCDKEGYWMLKYIVENQMLWEKYSPSQKLDVSKYQYIIKGLFGWEHGWPTRTRLNARLKYVKYLIKKNDPSQLIEAQDLLKEIKSYKAYQVGRSDKLRIAKVYKVIGSLTDDERAKLDFREEMTWSTDWLENNKWETIEF